MESVERTCLEKAVAWVSDTPLGSGVAAHRGGRSSGYVDHDHHAIFRLSKFVAAGGYNETFSHNEDAELDCRLGALGGRIFLDAGIRIEYYPRSTFGELFKTVLLIRPRSIADCETTSGYDATAPIRGPESYIAINLCIGRIAAYGFTTALAPCLHFRARDLFVSALESQKISLWPACWPAAFVMHTAWAFGCFLGLLSVREAEWKVERRSDTPASSLGGNA